MRKMSSFAIIPVLDLKAGEVVHARAGERAQYRPIETPLAAGSAPLEVLVGLLALGNFRRFYIADLDAITGVGDHRGVIADLARRHPEIEFWVDAGIATADAAVALAENGAVPVLGSETLASAAELTAAEQRLGPAHFILSLDYRGESFIGPAGIAADPAGWPERVIVMTLSRIGGSVGPDFVRLAGIRRQARERHVFAAGGVRDRADLEKLAAMQVAGVLVASALHDGRLDRAAIAAFSETG
jgi:phosphoribosylformimino-5-aminoimidazole carboxamide ribotide isomerase